MKSLKSKMIVLLAGFGILFSGLAFAHGPGWGQKGHMGFGSGSGHYMHDIMCDVKLGVLAELTGRSVEATKELLNQKPFWAILNESNVKFEIFQAKMHENATIALKKAVEDKKITKEQADFITERFNQGHKGYNRGKGIGCGGFGRGM